MLFAGSRQNGQQKLLALVDTGNSAMYLPEGIYDNFKEAVRTRTTLPTWSKSHVDPLSHAPPLTLLPFPPQVRTALRAFPSLIDRERSIFTGYAMYIAPEVLARMPTLALVMDNGLVFNLPPDVYTTEFRVRTPLPLPFSCRLRRPAHTSVRAPLFLLLITPPLTPSLLLLASTRRRTSPCPFARSR